MYWLYLFGLCVCVLNINSLEYKRNDIDPEKITKKGIARNPWFISVNEGNYTPRQQRFRVSVRKKTISPRNYQNSQSEDSRVWRFKNFLNSPDYGHAVSQLNSNKNLKKNVLPFTNDHQSLNDYIYHTQSDHRVNKPVYTSLPSFNKLSNKKVKKRFKGRPTSKLFIKPGDYRGRVSRTYDNVQYINDNYDDRSEENIFENYEEVSEEQKRMMEEYLKQRAAREGSRFSDYGSRVKLSPGLGPDPGSYEASHEYPNLAIHDIPGEGTDPGDREGYEIIDDYWSDEHESTQELEARQVGPDPGSHETSHEHPDSVINDIPWEGPQPDSIEDLHSGSHDKPSSGEGPYPGSHEVSHELHDFVINDIAEVGPDPGSNVDHHSHSRELSTDQERLLTTYLINEENNGNSDEAAPRQLFNSDEDMPVYLDGLPQLSDYDIRPELNDSWFYDPVFNGQLNIFTYPRSGVTNQAVTAGEEVNVARNLPVVDPVLFKDSEDYITDDQAIEQTDIDVRNFVRLNNSQPLPIVEERIANVTLPQDYVSSDVDAQDLTLRKEGNFDDDILTPTSVKEILTLPPINVLYDAHIILPRVNTDIGLNDNVYQDQDNLHKQGNFAADILTPASVEEIVTLPPINVLDDDHIILPRLNTDIGLNDNLYQDQDTLHKQGYFDDDLFTPPSDEGNLAPPPINVIYDDHIILPRLNTDIGLNDLYQDQDNVLHLAQLDTLTDDTRELLDSHDASLFQSNLNKITPLESSLLQVCYMEPCSVSNIRQFLQNKLVLPIVEDTNKKRKLNDLYQLLNLVMNIADDPELKSLHAIGVLTELIDHVNLEIAEKALNRKTLEIPSACHTVYTQNAWLKQYILALHEQIVNLQECKPYYDEFDVDNPIHNHGQDKHYFNDGHGHDHKHSHDQNYSHDHRHSHDHSHSFDQSHSHGHEHSHDYLNDGHLIPNDNNFVHPVDPTGPIVFPQDSEYRPHIDHPQINPFEPKPIDINANDLNIINNPNDGQLYPMNSIPTIQPYDDKMIIFEDQTAIPVNPLPNPDYPLDRFDIKQYDPEPDCSDVCVVDDKVVQHIWNKYLAGIEINELEHSILDKYVLKPNVNGKGSSYSDLTRKEPESRHAEHNHYSLEDHRNALYNTFVQINLRKRGKGARCADRCKYPLKPIDLNEPNPFSRLFISPGAYLNPVSDSLQSNSYMSSLDPTPKITNDFPLGRGIVPAEEKDLSHEKEKYIKDRYIKDINDNINDYNSLLDYQYISPESEIVKIVDSDLPGLKNRLSSLEEYYDNLPTPKKLADLKNYPYHSLLDHSSSESDLEISKTYLDLLNDRYLRFEDYYNNLPSSKRPVDIEKYPYFHIPFDNEYISQEKDAESTVEGSELPALTNRDEFTSWEEYYDNVPPRRPGVNYPEDLSNSVEYYDLTLPPDNMNSVFKPLLQNYVLITSEDLRKAYKMIVQTLKQVIKYLRKKNVNGRLLDFIVMEMIELILQEMEDGKLCKQSDRYQLFSEKLITTIKKKIAEKQNFSTVGVRDKLSIQTILEGPHMQEILGNIFEPMKLILKVERNVFSDYFR